MRASTDDELRRLERDLARAPGDSATAGLLARALLRLGRTADACLALGLRWEVPSGRLDGLAWGRTDLDPEAVRALVAADLAAFDPLRLAAHFPRRADGRYRLNVTRTLRRYRAHERGAPHRRLHLLAWTSGTGSDWHGHLRGKHLVMIELATRATRAVTLPHACWRAA